MADMYLRKGDFNFGPKFEFGSYLKIRQSLIYSRWVAGTMIQMNGRPNAQSSKHYLFDNFLLEKSWTINKFYFIISFDLKNILFLFSFNETLWIKLPTGIFISVKEWPTLTSALNPDFTISPIFKFLGAII